MSFSNYFSCFFKGENCQDHNVLAKKRPNIPAPKRRITSVKVAGRDGELVMDDEIYDPIVIPVEFNFLTSRPEAWGDVFRMAKQWLRGSGRLSFSDDPDWFFKCQYVVINDTERTTKRLGNFVAEFHCDPYMYKLAGEQPIVPADNSNKIFNPYMKSKPIYKISGSGGGSVTVNGFNFEFTSSGKLVIDTDRMEAWDPDTMEPMASRIAAYYPRFYLEPGINTVQISDGFSLEVIPAWRTI